MKLKITLGFLIQFILYRCRKEDQTQFTKDKELYNLLTLRSPTASLSGLILPRGQDLSLIPKNPLNQAKIQLGQLLFHKIALSINSQKAISINTYSYASCQYQGARFLGGLNQGIGDGVERYSISR